MQFGKYRGFYNFHKSSLTVCKIQRETRWTRRRARMIFLELFPKFRARNVPRGNENGETSILMMDSHLAKPHNPSFLKIEQIR